jgi:hypothetical protein
MSDHQWGCDYCKAESRPLPCPHCGCENILVRTRMLYCSQCFCGIQGDLMSKEEMIERWNRRVEDED